VYQDNFFIFENDIPIENQETSQFLTSADNLRHDVVLLLDYSNSAFLLALTAQQTHVDVFNQLRLDFPDETYPDFAGFETAADPLQYLYDQTVGKFLAELPDSYNISIMEFHDRDQGSRTIIDFVENNAAGNAKLLAALNGISLTDHGDIRFLWGPDHR
jgi:protein-tyrosine-phosphatase